MHITRRTLSAWVAPVLAGSATLLLASCGKPTATTSAPPTETNLVARVGNAVITLENFQAELNRRGRGTPARYATEAGRQELLDEMIRDQVLLERAKAAGLDRDPELLRRFDRMVIARFEETSKPATDKAALPTAAEIEQDYRARRAEFATAEKSRAAIVLLKGSTKAAAEKQAELRQRAEAVRAEALQLDAGIRDFGRVAQAHSEDHATRYQGGDGGWFERGRDSGAWPRAVTDALFALKNSGEISPVVEAGGSCYLVKLVERRAASVRPLAEVRELIAYRLTQQKKELAERHFHEQQRAGLRVEIDASVLARAQAPTSALAKASEVPPSLPAP